MKNITWDYLADKDSWFMMNTKHLTEIIDKIHSPGERLRKAIKEAREQSTATSGS